MAQTIQLVVEVDDKGVVTGMQRIRGAVQSLGPVTNDVMKTASTGFDRLASSEEVAQAGTVLFRQEQERLRESARLSAQLLGVEMPRAISKLMASNTAFQAVAATAFDAAVIAYFAEALVKVGERIADLSLAAGGYTEKIREAEKAELALNQQILTHPETLAAARENLDLIIKQRDETQRLGTSLSKESDLSKVILGYGQEIIGLREKDGDLAQKQNAILKEMATLTAAEKAALAQTDAQLAESGLQGFNAIRQRVIDLQLTIAKGHMAEIENIGADIAAGKELTDAQKHYLEAGALGQKENATLRRQLNDEAIKLAQQAGAVGLGTLDAIAKRAADEIADLQRKYKELGASPTDSSLQRDVGAIQTRAAKETMDAQMDMQRKMAEQVAQAEDEAAVASVAPWQRANAQIEVEFERRIRQISDDERDALKQAGDNANLRAQIEEDADERRKNAALSADAKMLESDRQLNERLREFDLTTVESERAAAVASLPVWQRADAQIVAEYQDRIGRIEKQERELQDFYRGNADAINQIEADAQRQRQAAWQDANARIADNWRETRDKLANDLESLFTGDIGQNILKQVEHFFFQILAQWLMTLGDMRQAAAGGAGGGGLLGAIFGSITGMGGGRSGGAQLPTGVQTTFPGGSSFLAPGTAYYGGGQIAAGSTACADTSGGYFGGPMIVPPGTPAAEAQLPVGAAPSIPGLPPDLLSVAIPSNWPGGTGASTSSIPPISTGPLGTGLPSAGVSLPSITRSQAALGLAGAGIGLVGAKLGGTAGSIGGLIAMLGIMGAKNPAMLGGLAMIPPAIMAAAGGGLIGFGIGQKFGKLPGAIGGAASGLGIASLMGMLGVGMGPIGFAVAGIVGLIGGIFGGLLGGSQRRAQANAYAAQQVEPALAKALDAYNTFQSDYASTLAGLVDIEDQAQKALQQLKGEGSDVFKNRVEPDVAKALAQIQDTEDERQRRAALTFGPPQFQHGGFIAPELPRTMTGGILAELHPEEFVSTAAATAQHRAQLEAWNLEAATGGGTPSMLRRPALPQFEQGGFVSGELAGFRLSSGQVMASLQRGPSAPASQSAQLPPVHLHLQAWDGESVDRWLRNGGARKLRKALLREGSDYSGSGDNLGRS